MHQSTSLLLILTSLTTTLSHPQPQLQQPITGSKSSLSIPSIGLGLWNSKAEDATSAVISAFKSEYHHFDSAAAYDNEAYVGHALSNSSTPPRSSYWMTSKIWNTMHRPENVPKALAQTLHDLNSTYLDLFLMHWPVAFEPDQPGRNIIDQRTSILDTWRAMESLVSKNRSHPEAGTTRYIGISNFSPRQVDDLLAQAEVKPYAHEFETHPYLQQQEWVDWHHEHGIKVIAYSPLGNTNPTYDSVHPEVGELLEDQFWKDLAGEKKCTVAQAVLGWGLARDTVVIPKSVHADRIKENLGAGDVKFTKEQMAAIAEQDKKARFNNPSKDWGVELFEGLDDGPNNIVPMAMEGELK